MIAYISGKVLEKNTSSIIVEVGGIGYEIIVPLTTFYEIGEVGSSISLRVYTHVREDAMQLYGFLTEKDRKLFLKLISVQGISTKSAISILSKMNADEFAHAILSKDTNRLMTIPGVGRKLAERLLVELKDKLQDFELTADSKVKQDFLGSEYHDAINALINLGYQRNVAENAIKVAIEEGTEIDVKKLLKRSLQILSKV